MVSIRVGSNLFNTEVDFCLVGRDIKGRLGAGRLDRFSNPIIWIRQVDGEWKLNARINDSTPELVLEIVDNEICVNKDNIYKMHNDAGSFTVINQNGETALELRYSGSPLVINFDLYDGKDHLLATDEGIIGNPNHPHV